MKYKIGDRVRIKNDIRVGNVTRDIQFIGLLAEHRGKIMTIKEYVRDGIYRMNEGYLNWSWAEEWIEGLAEPTNAEILQRAIDTCGVKKQALVCIEEMSELTKALIKLYRAEGPEEKEAAREHVREEVADTKIMLHQMSMIFGEKKIAEIQEQKIERLHNNLKGEQEVEVVTGVHEIGGKIYVWQNPGRYTVKPGCTAIANTKYGDQPIIVEGVRTDKKKNVKQHRCITRGIRNE